jgi:hypothetical protein
LSPPHSQAQRLLFADRHSLPHSLWLTFALSFAHLTCDREPLTGSQVGQGVSDAAGLTSTRKVWPAQMQVPIAGAAAAVVVVM